MPELPDITVYLEALEHRILNQTLESVQISSPFLLRTAVRPISSVEGKRVVGLRRLGKRICIGLEEDLWLVLHLMIAGRLHWKQHAGAVATGRSNQTMKKAMSRPPKNRLGVFYFTTGTLSWTEAGTQRRASLHLVQGENELRRFDAGGLEVFDVDLKTFAERLQSANHTLKRALTDPRLFSGIGNAFSDEITLGRTIIANRADAKIKCPAQSKSFSTPLAKPLKSGLTSCALKPERNSRKRSRPFVPGWRCMANTVNLARAVEKNSSAFVTQPTKPIIVRLARPVASFGRPRTFTTIALRLAAHCGRVGAILNNRLEVPI